MTERDLFIAALQKDGPAQRQAYLDEACAGQPELRRQVEDLLHLYENAGSFLQKPAAGSAATGAFHEAPKPMPSPEAPGAVIGPYKLIEQIGEGGMGTVWMAQQTEPVKRLVAVKLIKAGMDSKQVIARFEAERQALALMDHPNIAKVLDGGTTGERPYFVMDLVKGVPITKYCDEHHLTPRQRLELFIPVCQAVQHAHQKGIIHRDLKPSNVLVALYDGKPVPKVIDFGVAKAAGQSLTDKTLVTGFGNIVGTLEYMSPEQAEINQLDIDTRSDIYALGVLLYELLTGSPPFSRKELDKAGMLEMLRVIREQEPSRPSTKLSTAEGLPTLAANRGTEPAKLTKLVRGELDWIVMKALEKDRNRRYETANGFAMDVQRYLTDEPVQACPPSAGYRLRKFVRRNKGRVLAASLVLFVLVCGIIGTTWGMIRATFAEADAVREAGEKTVALGEKEAALATAKTNEIQAKAAQKDAQENFKEALAAVDQMLTRVAEDKLAYVPQMEPIRRDLLLDALKFYQKFLDKQRDDPALRREVAFAHRRLGRIHAQLGQDQDADGAYRNAIEMLHKLVPSSFAEAALLREIVNCHIEFSWTLGALGKAEEAVQNIRRAVELADKLDREVPSNRRYIYNARNHLASVLTSQQPEEAEKILKGNLALGGDALILEGAHRLLGDLFMRTQRLPEAEEAYRQAVGYVEKLAAEAPSANWIQYCLANDLRILAGLLTTNRRPAEAEEYLRRAILIGDKLATDFPARPGYRQSLALAQVDHAGVLKQLGRPAEAEKAYRRATDLHAKLVADFPMMPTYLQAAFDQHLTLAQFLTEAGKLQEARLVYQQASPLLAKMPDDFSGRIKYWEGLVRTHMESGRLLAKANKPKEAEAAFRQAVDTQNKLEREFGQKADYRRNLALSHARVAYLLSAAGLTQDAGKLGRFAIAHLEKLAEAPPDNPEQQRADAELCHNVGHKLSTLAEKERAFYLAVKLRDTFLAHSPSHAYDRAMQGHGYRHLGFITRRTRNRPQEEEKYFRLALQLFDQLNVDFPQNAHYQEYLASTSNELAWLFATARDPKRRDPKQAVELARKAAALAPKDANVWNTLGAAHYRAGNWKEAITALQKYRQLRIDDAEYANPFFLAMAHWQLGDKDDARKWHKKAVEWMEKNQPRDDELRRFHVEAEQLLGIEKKKD